MKIWLVETSEPLPTDPTVRVLRFGILAKLLAERGHEVTWWTSSFEHASKLQRVARTTTWNPAPGLEIRLLFSPRYRRNVSIARVVHNRVLARKFLAEGRQASRPDLIFCALPTLEMAEVSVELGRRFQIPVVVDAQDKWPDQYVTVLPHGLRWLGRLLLTSEFRRVGRIGRRATALTAVSRGYLKWILSHAGRTATARDRVVPYGYLPSAHLAQIEEQVEAEVVAVSQRWKLGPNDLVATYAGSFGRTYDLETVIHTARLMQDQLPHVRIVLTGGGDQEPRIRAMARHLPNVTLTGWLGIPTLVAVLRRSAIGLAPFVSDAMQELPYKAFDYMAASLPILSSLGGDLKQLLHDAKAGLHYTAGDPRSLLVSLRWLIENPDERRAMGANGQQLLEAQFNSEHEYPRLIEYLVNSSRYAPD